MIQFIDDGKLLAEWADNADYVEATRKVAENAVRAMMPGEWGVEHTKNMLQLMTAIDRMCGYQSFILQSGIGLRTVQAIPPEAN